MDAGNRLSNTVDTGGGGLDNADDAFHAVCHGTSRLVQLLADEMVPLDDATVSELSHVIEVMRAALPHLAAWRGAKSPEIDWVLEPPLSAVGVNISAPADLLDYDNVARLRRSFEFLAPNSMALRKETATVVTDALLDLLVRVS